MSGALGTELSLHADRDAWVEDFSLEVSTSTSANPGPDRVDNDRRLEEDLEQERQRRSDQRRQKIREIDAHFSKTR